METCRLCRKARKLRRSHVIPELVYRPLYDTDSRALYLDGGTGKRRVVQKGYYEPLLCGECETIFQRVEHYFSILWHQRDPLPDPVEGQYLERNGFDFDQFFRFHLSILWRASVAHGEIFSAVSLGPFEEPFRLFLIGDVATLEHEPAVYAWALRRPRTNELWNRLLRSLLQVLDTRGIARRWAQSETPYADLDRECTVAASHSEFADQFGRYLRMNPVVRLSVQTFLAHISVAANVRPEQVPWPQQVLMPLGTRIARWLPTFLVIDGPLGRFLRVADSPLNELLQREHATYPALAQARDIFNHDLFRRLRNGVGHWAFAWEQDNNGGERFVCFDWESGERTADAGRYIFHPASRLGSG